MRYGNGAERPLPVTADAPHGALGEPRFHPNTAQVAVHEAAQVQCGDQVRSSPATKSPPVLLPVLRVLIHCRAVPRRLPAQSPQQPPPPRPRKRAKGVVQQGRVLVDHIRQQLSHPRALCHVPLHGHGGDQRGDAGQWDKYESQYTDNSHRSHFLPRGLSAGDAPQLFIRPVHSGAHEDVAGLDKGEWMDL